MKSEKYLILFIAAVFISAGGYLLYKAENRVAVAVPTPSPTATIQNTNNFSIENAPTDSLKGQIATMSGEVDWKGRTATMSSKVNSPITIQQGENLITGMEGSLTLAFPDVCSIIFSKNTEVDIIQTLPENIVFSQVSGTAEYSIIGSELISIRSSSLLTELTGNAVITRNDKKPIVSVRITKGKAVMAYNDLNYKSHEVNISAGQTYIFNYGTRKGVLK